MLVFVATLAMRVLAMGPLFVVLRPQASLLARPTNRPNHHVNGSWAVCSQSTCHPEFFSCLSCSRHRYATPLIGLCWVHSMAYDHDSFAYISRLYALQPHVYSLFLIRWFWVGPVLRGIPHQWRHFKECDIHPMDPAYHEHICYYGAYLMGAPWIPPFWFGAGY